MDALSRDGLQEKKNAIDTRREARMGWGDFGGSDMTVEQVRIKREVRNANAKAAAEMLPSGDYYADGSDCVNRVTGARTACANHWDACLVMLYAGRAA